MLLASLQQAFRENLINGLIFKPVSESVKGKEIDGFLESGVLPICVSGTVQILVM